MKSAQLFNMQCHSSAVGSYRRGGDDRSADAAVVSFAEQSRRRMTVPGFLATAHVSLLELVSRGLVFKETRRALALGVARGVGPAGSHLRRAAAIPRPLARHRPRRPRRALEVRRLMDIE